jgi:hypothetical protein
LLLLVGEELRRKFDGPGPWINMGWREGGWFPGMASSDLDTCDKLFLLRRSIWRRQTTSEESWWHNDPTAVFTGNIPYLVVVVSATRRCPVEEQPSRDRNHSRWGSSAGAAILSDRARTVRGQLRYVGETDFGSVSPGRILCAASEDCHQPLSPCSWRED